MLSAVVLTKNEEDNIADCLDCLSFADEIIVLDDNSTDRTIDIVKNLKKDNIQVIISDLNNDFSSQRNLGLSKSKGEWVLFVDADERVPEQLASEIKNATTLDRNGFYIKRKDFLFGKEIKYGEAGNIKLLRLGRKEAGEWKRKVHEVWEINGKVGDLEKHISHYPHKTIRGFLEEVNFYTDIRAKELYENGVRSNFFSIIFYPFGKFILNYFFKSGFKDGIVGLILALVMSFHSFLVRGKLWTLWKNQK